MNLLLLDTSCPTGVVAFARQKEVVSKRYLTETRQHSEVLSEAVSAVLAEAQLRVGDLHAVVVTKGPGSFIGVRIAVAYAKGLCLATKIPLVGVGTLESFAHDPAVLNGKVLAVLDARRSEFYVQEFMKRDNEISPISLPYLHPYKDLVALSNKFDAMVGFGWAQHLATSAQVHQLEQGPSAEGILMAFCSLQSGRSNLEDETLTLVPQYVRDPDAKPFEQ